MFIVSTRVNISQLYPLGLFSAYLLNVRVEWTFSKKREEFSITPLQVEGSGK